MTGRISPSGSGRFGAGATKRGSRRPTPPEPARSSFGPYVPTIQRSPACKRQPGASTGHVSLEGAQLETFVPEPSESVSRTLPDSRAWAPDFGIHAEGPPTREGGHSG